MRRYLSAAVVGVFMAASLAGFAASGGAQAQDPGDSRVSAGSPASPFSSNKQNEPAVAVDPVHTNIVAAGANDNIDMEACNAGADNTCPFTDGVGVSGIYFSTNSGSSWSQPAYRGYSARNCTGVVGDSDPPCQPATGPIGTLPNYDKVGLVSDGDPALVFGPVPGSNGRFSWGNGSRLYYANLAAAFPGSGAFKGAEAIAVSHTDDITGAMAGRNSAWSDPVIASKQNGAKFSDKEQIWADNAQNTSPYFGNVYVCYAAFVGNGKGFTGQSLHVTRSTDGGTTWKDTQVTTSSNNVSSSQGFGRSGCTVRTDSTGTAYVFYTTFGVGSPGPMRIDMVTSTNGGANWTQPVTLFHGSDTCVAIEPAIGRCVEDGVGGARDDLGPAPSVDIANGAPLGTDATNRIVITWVDGRDGLNEEHVLFASSTNGGKSWSNPSAIERPGDRGYYSAPAISPNGKDVYLVYNAFTTPFRTSAIGPGNDRQLVGVVLHADVTASAVGAFTEVHRGQSGDARGSSQNDLAAEFLGDYVYAAATRTYGVAVWNDVRDADHCAAVDQYRQDLHDYAVATGSTPAEGEEPRGESGPDRADKPSTGGPTPPTAPAVQTACAGAPRFGNSDIYGASIADPTP